MAMSFAIEAPGEALPLDEKLLCNTLQAASSSDVQQIQRATQQFQQWEKSPSYFVHLQSVYLDRSLALEIRYLAIIQLKNGIDKYWRRTATNAISKEDKKVIRLRLIDCVLVEPDRRLTAQLALVYSKIARFEFPNEWPEAITLLLQWVRQHGENMPQGDDHKPDNAVRVLLQVIKELSTGRLARTRAFLQGAAPDMFTALKNRYIANVEGWRLILTSGQGTEVLEASMEGSLLSIRALRRVIIQGFDHPNRHEDVAAFWQQSIQNIGHFYDLRQQGRWSPKSSELLQDHMLQLSKLHHEMARDHPAAFVLLPRSLMIIYDYWAMAKGFSENFAPKGTIASAIRMASLGTDTSSALDRPETEKFILRGMSMIRACLKMVHQPTQTFKYQHAQDKEERTKAVENMKGALTPAFIQDVMQTTVTQFFVLRAADLRDWEEQPEEWEAAQEVAGDDFDTNLRSCAEKLFLDISIYYKEIIADPVLRVFDKVSSPENSGNILEKDAVYNAVGLAAPTLQETLDFDGFVRERLCNDVSSTQPGHNILRRRAAVMLGQWITIKVGEASKPQVYDIFRHLLTKEDQPLNDQVVRITAGRQMKNIVDEWEFKSQQFMPYAQSIVNSLMSLIDEVDSIETKMALLETVSVIVERLQHDIAPLAELIANPLPSLWDQAGDEHLMKQTILTLLARLVASLKADSLPLHDLALPIIRQTITGSDEMYWLLEDSLDLWANVVAQTPASSASDRLLGLTLYLPPLFDLGNENIRKVLEIADAYTLLAPERMLSPDLPYRSATFTALAPLINTLKPEPNGLACTLVETSLRCASQLGSEADIISLASDMVATSFLPHLLLGLHGSYKAHCTSGPRAETPPIDGIVETDHLAILARLILGCTDAFSQAITACAAQLPETSHGASTPDNVMRWLLEEWFSHFENVGDAKRRKLMCLALTKLLETNTEWILLSLQSLMTMWTDVVVALREEEGDQATDSVVWQSDVEDVGNVPKAPEDERKEALEAEDLVTKVNVEEWIKHYLGGCVAASPGFEQEWVSNVDRDVVAAFGALGIM